MTKKEEKMLRKSIIQYEQQIIDREEYLHPKFKNDLYLKYKKFKEEPGKPFLKDIDQLIKQINCDQLKIFRLANPNYKKAIEIFEPKEKREEIKKQLLQ